MQTVVAWISIHSSTACLVLGCMYSPSTQPIKHKHCFGSLLLVTIGYKQASCNIEENQTYMFVVETDSEDKQNSA